MAAEGSTVGGSDFAITVRAKPESRRVSVRLLESEQSIPVLEVKVRAKPEAGAANAAVIAAVAEAFGIPRSCVTIRRGHTSRIKHLRVAADPEVIRRLPWPSTT